MAFGGVLRSAASPASEAYGIGGDANTIWHCQPGTDLIYELSTTDFSVDRSSGSPGGAPGGIGGDANTIWHCDTTEDEIYELSTSDFSVDRFAASPATVPFGIGGDANTIWHSDTVASRVYELSTSDFSVDRFAGSPGASATGIGGDATTIWHCDYVNVLVYELSTSDFSVDRSTAAPADEPYGIGGDKETIWFCDRKNDFVYELDAAQPPDPPTNVQATDGVHTDKVVVTWNKSAGATGYKVYEDSNLLDTLGDVATYDDTDAPAPTITPGTAAASDGTSADHVSLSLSGESANNGASRTYKVVAFNANGDSDPSGTNTGYRGVGALTYQWQRSAADSDADYSNIVGGTTDPYNDTGAPENGDGRYYRCVENATGATQQISSVDRGYRTPPVGLENKSANMGSKMVAAGLI